MAKGKTVSKYIINGSGQMPTLCELPDPKIGSWKVVLCVDEENNGKNGKPLVVGQKCATVQGLAYEVRGGKVEKADIECRCARACAALAARVRAWQRARARAVFAHLTEGPAFRPAPSPHSNGVIHVLDTVLIPDVKFCGV